jgi:O-antigen biosynthesis protein
MFQAAANRTMPSAMRALLLDPDREAEGLGLAAAAALRSGNMDEALALSDRLVRMTTKAPAPFRALRIDALRLSGRGDAAVDDLRDALKVWPESELLLSRLMGLGTGTEALNAARRLADVAATTVDRCRASRRLFELGEDVVCRMIRARRWLRGWICTKSRAPVIIRLSDGLGNIAEHALEPGHVPDITGRADLCFWPLCLELREGLWVHVEAWQAGQLLQRLTQPLADSTDERQALAGETVDLSVIVPVYGDLEATRACLQSLADVDLGSKRWRVILINDASPEAGMAELVADAARHGHVRAFTNTRNLGFAGTVNRALAMTDREDVILLNADTVVPPAAFARLMRQAQEQSDIGTITPLSGNGELVSIPRPFVSNGLPSAEVVTALDEAASQLFAGRSLVLPAGIGFCLYVTRQCLDLVGPLSEAYGRGYGEDIAFCLEARRAGLSNLCALDTYVGHHGTLSFQGDKPGLVARNLKRIEAEYPDFRAECEAFMAADPLQEIRRTLLLAVPPIGQRHILAAAAGVAMSVARRRGAVLAEAGTPVMYLELRSGVNGTTLGLWCSDAPHDATIWLATGTDDGRRQFAHMIDGVSVARLEVFGHATDVLISEDVLAAFRDIVDFVWIDRPPAGAGGNLFARYSRILVPTKLALQDVVRHGPELPVELVRLSGPELTADQGLNGKALALVLLDPTMPARRLRRQFTCAIHRTLPATRLVVFGANVLDDGLASLPSLRFTGPFADADIAALAEIHGIGAALILDRGLVHGHPVVEAFRDLGLPVSFIDDASSSDGEDDGGSLNWIRQSIPTGTDRALNAP